MLGNRNQDRDMVGRGVDASELINAWRKTAGHTGEHVALNIRGGVSGRKERKSRRV